jgi:hypothetical protein
MDLRIVPPIVIYDKFIYRVPNVRSISSLIMWARLGKNTRMDGQSIKRGEKGASTVQTFKRSQFEGQSD